MVDCLPMGDVPNWMESHCLITGPAQATCVGKGVVLRISFGNFIFFAAHMLLLLCVSKEADLRRFIHTGLLPLQGIGWLGIIIACFAMPNHVLAVYGQARHLCQPCESHLVKCCASCCMYPAWHVAHPLILVIMMQSQADMMRSKTAT